MSKVPPPKTASPPAAPQTPPDLSGGGDTIVEAPPEGRSTRPGPQPKVIRETFANPSMATAPDVKLLNERKYDAARSKVREQALTKMPDISIGKHLPGSPPIETEEPTQTEVPAEGETTETEAPALDEKTAAQIAAKDREVRELRRKIRTIEQSGQSKAKKFDKLMELAKTNPKGVADYLGISVQDYILAVQKGDAEALKLDEPETPPETDETTRLRDENNRLKAAQSKREATEYVASLVSTQRDEGGKLRWPRIARVGPPAIVAATDAAVREIEKMRKLSPEEARQVVEHFLDAKENEYKSANAGDEAPRRQAPNPRTPQKVPNKSPMEIRHAKDESDPRNRPNSREIAARLRARLVGS